MVAKPNNHVDIVVITWNSIEYLKCCLESIRKYTDNVPYRIIIVDNGSNDGTQEYLANFRIADMLIKRNNNNQGYPKALFQGYELSGSKFICVMNDDIIVSPKWLSNLIKVLEYHADVGIVGPVRPGAAFIHPYKHALSKAILEESKTKYKTPTGQLGYFTYGKEYASFVKDFKKVNKPSLILFDSLPHMISTCCALVRRQAIERVGGIVDLRFTKYGGDDVDLSWRLMKAGFKLAITSESYVHHFEHVSLLNNKFDRQRHLRLNAKRLYMKWKKDINDYLVLKTEQGLTKEQILQGSWLLQRLANILGKQFWLQD